MIQTRERAWGGVDGQVNSRSTDDLSTKTKVLRLLLTLRRNIGFLRFRLRMTYLPDVQRESISGTPHHLSRTKNTPKLHPHSSDTTPGDKHLFQNNPVSTQVKKL